MPNQRADGVSRVTVTLPEDLLEAIEEAAKSRGVDRLELIREATRVYLGLSPEKTPKKKTPKKGNS